MKKVLLTTMISIALIFSANLMAQTHFGVKASFNMQNFMSKDASGNKIEDLKMIPAFDAGVYGEFGIADEFYLRPELLFKQKGSKSDLEVLGVNTEAKSKLNYIELPVYFLYKGALGNGNILLGVGPAFAYGIGGKSSVTISGSPIPALNGTTTTDVKFKGDVKVGDDLLVDYYAPLDISGNVMFGYELSNGLSASIVAQLGLVNIENKYEGNKPDNSIKNIGFGISLGYRIK